MKSNKRKTNKYTQNYDKILKMSILKIYVLVNQMFMIID
jgi:hypothetical protein